MTKTIGISYNVCRRNATKSTNIGDFTTLEEAQAKMLEHFRMTPKRGTFEYIIREEELQDCGGYVMRVFSMSISGRGQSNYYKRYSRAELEQMSA